MPSGSVLGADSHAQIVARLGAKLAEVRARTQQPPGEAPRGLALARQFSAEMDEILRELWDFAVDTAPRPLGRIRIALGVTGGYGRQELSPRSDLDLLFLTDKPDAPEVRALAERLLYPLWDLKLECGHAVRSVAHTVDLAAKDLATATAVLDARFLAGYEPLFEDLARAMGRQIAPEDANGFIQRLRQELASRHAKFGDALYLLEPNLKHGRGGLRDLCSGFWAIRARFRVNDFADLLSIGQASERQVGLLVEARDFLLGVRGALHAAAGRRQDQLLFELQETIAPHFVIDSSHDEIARANDNALGAEVRPAVAPQVEALMRGYYLHARAIVRETERLLDRATVHRNRKTTSERIDDVFVLANGHISAVNEQVFRDRPAEMLRLFRVALDLDRPVLGATKEHVAEICHELVAKDPECIANDPAATAHFLALLLDPRDRNSPSVLEELHDLGLLSAVMPEFGPCTARVQHDIYHVFTVDQHQLYAVARLKALARGELAKEQPHATRAIGEVTRQTSLYLGTLLHDVGKPLGKGHSEKGARLAKAITTRFGLAADEIAQTEFLVREHLVMAHLSQRRDVNDVAMIANFAAEMGDEESLRQLYLLTLADMSMVAPGNLSEWKDRLLRELYVRALAHLRRGPDLVGETRGTLVAHRKVRVAELLDQPEAEVSAELAGLPDRYFTANSPRTIARHVRLFRRRALEGKIAAVEVVHRVRRGYSELTVVAEDVPGLLAQMAGVLLANRIDVLSAQISSRVVTTARGARAEAIDTYFVRDRSGNAILDASRWARVEADLTLVLSGEKDREALVSAAAARERSQLKPKITPKVPTEIEVDNDVSDEYTVIDVYTQDRLGVLYAITKTLFECGLDIALSKVTSEAERVADVFYVRDRRTGSRVTDQADIARLTNALTSALAAV